MPANNLGGENGRSYFQGGAETPYGATKRLEESTKAAPIPSAPGMHAPKKAQNRAVKGQQPQVPPGPSPEQQVLAAPPTPQNVWAEVLAVPGIRVDLVEAWAQGA